MRPDRVTVVVPTYNERDNLVELVPAVLGHGLRMLVVDDASPDGTGRLADRLAHTSSGLAVLHRQAKQGLGPAYVAGFDRALADGAEVVVEMDADFSHDPGDLPHLLEALEAGADLAIGSRYVEGGATPDWPLHRRAISRGGNWYARAMLGLPLRDATGGFRAYRAAALRSLDYPTICVSGYVFQVELARRAVERRLRVVEVPIVFRDRRRGTSKMGPRIVAEAMVLVTRWGIRRMASRLPWSR
ncbi:MAG: polyprenol monophosphomannose synthase [Acidimicrobiia bacterium]